MIGWRSGRGSCSGRNRKLRDANAVAKMLVDVLVLCTLMKSYECKAGIRCSYEKLCEITCAVSLAM